MRRVLFAGLLLTVALCPAVARAQSRPSLVVTDVRLGFSGGLDAGSPTPLFKSGHWAPVYVEIKAEAPGYKPAEGRVDVVVSTADPDDITTSYTVDTSLPELPAEKTYTVLAYTKLASSSPEITTTLRSGGQQIGQSFKKTFNGLDPGQTLYLTLGSRLKGLRDANRGDEDRDALPESLAYADRVNQLPTQWFGYQGVDAIILCTGNRQDFVLPLAASPPHLTALREWVERGGHLVVCAGSNARGLGNLEELLPVTFSRTEPFTELDLNLPDVDGPLAPVAGKNTPITVARFELEKDPKTNRSRAKRKIDPVTKKVGPVVHTLHDVPDPADKELPLIVQAPMGLGRVTVVAFDTDQKPFVEWNGQRSFWQAFMKRAGIAPPAVKDEAPMRGDYSHPQDLIGDMQSYLEDFEDVQPIPFGWVFLFILVYILVVGPVEYFVLLKVLKRPELTWITFPTVVLSLSAIAYFAAYQLKGKDLRVRKVDVVDVDLRGGQTMGHTWFSLFSPRIQHYKVGIEPTAPDWAPPLGDEKKLPVVVSWMSRPEFTGRGGRPKARRQSLFRRSYDYAEDASGLIGVPVQVWSTKAFTATWLTPTGSQPLVKHDLHWEKNGDRTTADLRGSLTWCPAGKDQPALEVAEAHLAVNGKVYKVNLEPGKEATLKTLIPFPNEGAELNAWLQPRNEPQEVYYSRRGGWQNEQAPDVAVTLREAFFHRAQERNPRNAGLRQLDQTWRLRQDQQEEVILLVRLKSRQGAAESITQDAASPSRLWLGALPGTDEKRVPIDGQMRQDTFIRVFIPVQP